MKKFKWKAIFGFKWLPDRRKLKSTIELEHERELLGISKK